MFISLVVLFCFYLCFYFLWFCCRRSLLKLSVHVIAIATVGAMSARLLLPSLILLPFESVKALASPSVSLLSQIKIIMAILQAFLFRICCTVASLQQFPNQHMLLKSRQMPQVGKTEVIVFYFEGRNVLKLLSQLRSCSFHWHLAEWQNLLTVKIRMWRAVAAAQQCLLTILCYSNSASTAREMPGARSWT